MEVKFVKMIHVSHQKATKILLKNSKILVYRKWRKQQWHFKWSDFQWKQKMSPQPNLYNGRGLCCSCWEVQHKNIANSMDYAKMHMNEKGVFGGLWSSNITIQEVDCFQEMLLKMSMDEVARGDYIYYFTDSLLAILSRIYSVLLTDYLAWALRLWPILHCTSPQCCTIFNWLQMSSTIACSQYFKQIFSMYIHPRSWWSFLLMVVSFLAPYQTPCNSITRIKLRTSGLIVYFFAISHLVNI